MDKQISLELATKIAEVVKEKGAKLLESEKIWFEFELTHLKLDDPREVGLFDRNEIDPDKDEVAYPAYDCQELGEILPFMITKKYNGTELEHALCVQKVKNATEDGRNYLCCYSANSSFEIMARADGYIRFKTMAEAMGNMLLHLLTHDLL